MKSWRNGAVIGIIFFSILIGYLIYNEYSKPEGWAWVSNVEWDGNEWVIVYQHKIGDMFGTSNPPVYLKFDGVSFEKITEPSPIINEKNISIPNPNIPEEYDRIASYGKIYWNGEYWLIITNQIYKFDGSLFEEVSGPDPSIYINTDAEFNGEYWLISFGANNAMGYLGRYDGETFEKLHPSLSGPHYVFDVEWNGNYWLIGTHDVEHMLLKYDGENFSDLTGDLNNAIYGNTKPNFKRFINPPGYN